MNRTYFEACFKTASPYFDKERAKKEQLRTLDSEPVFIGETGTRNLVIAMEELSELSKEISKYLRGKREYIALTEEIGDVYLALDYVKSICHVSEEDINKSMNVKIDQLANTEGTYE